MQDTRRLTIIGTSIRVDGDEVAVLNECPRLIRKREWLCALLNNAEIGAEYTESDLEDARKDGYDAGVEDATSSD